MKLIALLYLEDDEEGVRALLDEHRVVAYSELHVEGHGSGRPGWYGDVAPYDSHLIFTLVPAERARQLLAAVEECTGCKDPRHPIHAFQVDVERMVSSGHAHGTNAQTKEEQT